MRCKRKQRTERGHGWNSTFRTSSFARCAFATDDRTVPCPCTADALVVRVIGRAVIVPLAGFTLPFEAFAALTTVIVRSVCVLFRSARVFDTFVVCCMRRGRHARAALAVASLEKEGASSDISYSGDVCETVVVVVELEVERRDPDLDGCVDAGGEKQVCEDEDIRDGR